MRKWNRILALTAGALLALGTAASFAQQQQQQQQQQKPQQRDKTEQQGPYVVMMVPVAFALDEKLANGCWVRFYDGNNYEGEFSTLIGPVDIAEMDGFPAFGGPDSAIVGPNANVVLYDDDGYQDRTVTLNAGQRVPDLGDERLGLFEDIESLKMTCS